MTMNPTLLIVDDSKVSRMMIGNFIKSKKPDWKLVEAANGEEALKKDEELDIDYYSIDLNMPGIDGLEVISQLHGRDSASNIVLMTANIQKDVQERAQEFGAACVHKPVTEESVDKMLDHFND